MIYKIAPEIEEYFLEQYKKCPVTVVPGHWPELNTKEEVDDYINFLNMVAEISKTHFKEEEEI